jgi:hypothetical protein
MNDIRASRIEINWHPGISIYASETFLKTVGDEYGWLGGIDESGYLRCVLPYTVIRKATIRLVRFRVETIPLSEPFGTEEEMAFLNSVVEHFRSNGTDMIIPATTNTIFRTFPDGAIAAPYGTYIIDLDQPEEKIWGNLNQSHRRKVRLGMKQGVKILSGTEYMDMAYFLIRDTLKRSKLGFMSQKIFRHLVQSLKNHLKIYVAEYNGKIHGCAIYPYSTHSAYYLYGGSIEEPENGALHLMHWEAIRHFRELGVNRYDFVGVRINPEKGSKQEGLMMFKERFGGRLVQGYMWKFALQPIKYGVYSLAVRLLRGGDIVDNEKHKLSGGSYTQ